MNIPATAKFMNRIILSLPFTLAAFIPFAARGQDAPADLNRFSFGPTFGLNFKADFNNQSANPGPATGDANHSYNDGYVRVDSSGDAGGLTTYWGYQNASQVVGNTMQFHAVQGGSSSATGNPQYGGEFMYQRVLGTLPFISGDWGLETAFGFTEIDLQENYSGTVPVTLDTYQLGGVVPPGPGYNGTFQGPGPLLGDTPTRSTTSANVAGYQRLSGQLFSLRLGPFAELNITHKLSLAASVGLTLAPATVDYDFSETATLSGGGVIADSGHSSRTRLLYGPYAGATLNYDFTKCWGLYVGARFQNLTDLDQSVNGRNARLDLGSTMYATIGATWKF
jgi:hypothetical protein